MSYHIISIDTPECTITVSKGQLLVLSGQETKSIPMEDVASIVITAFQCTLSGNFLIEAAKKRIGVILCELYKPIAIVLPVNRGTETSVLRNIARLSPQLKRRLWQKTVDAKCMNQFNLAKNWNPSHPKLEELYRLAVSHKDTKESETARLFWSIFSDSYTQGQFKRDRLADDFNSLFNYAYAILLSCILRNLLALGIDPTFGIFHVERAHATPLAYDLMEPFRVLFDSSVAEWITEQRRLCVDDAAISKITPEYRKYISSVLFKMIKYQKRDCSLKQAIELVIRTFRSAVLALESGYYEPWII